MDLNRLGCVQQLDFTVASRDPWMASFDEAGISGASLVL